MGEVSLIPSGSIWETSFCGDRADILGNAAIVLVQAASASAGERQAAPARRMKDKSRIAIRFPLRTRTACLPRPSAVVSGVTLTVRYPPRPRSA